MVNFDYCNPARIIFGQGAEKQLPALFNEYNVNSLLLIKDGDRIKKLGVWDIIKTFCDESNIPFIECSNVVSNPKIDYVRELVEIGKKNKVDFVLAFGGGSVIDTAKAVALGIPYEADVWDFFYRRRNSYKSYTNRSNINTSCKRIRNIQLCYYF